MIIKELKRNKEYCFECNITKRRVLNKIADTTYFDEWGCAFISLGQKIGVEYNLCVDNGENSSGIYKVDYNEKDGCIVTNYDEFFHYEIDFDNRKWKEKLENAMCKALIEFFEL